MNPFIQRRIPGLIATVTMLLFSAPTMAFSGRDAGDQFKMNINISGTVVATGTCTFDNSVLGEIDFGNVTYSTDIGFKLIGEYRQKLNSAMTCSGDTVGTTTMTFTDQLGNAVDFNGHKLLSISNANHGGILQNLGIEFLANGEIQDVGTAFTVDLSNPPQLEANLVQIGSSADAAIVEGNTILASAVLTMEFQ